MCICVYVYIYLLFHTLFHYGLSKDIEYNSLCYTYDLVVYSVYNSLHLLTWNPTPSLRSLLFLPLGNHKFVLSSLWVCLESLHISSICRLRTDYCCMVCRHHAFRDWSYSHLFLWQWHVAHALVSSSCSSVYMGLCISAELGGIPGPWFGSKSATFLWKWSLWKDWLSHCLRFLSL